MVSTVVGEEHVAVLGHRQVGGVARAGEIGLGHVAPGERSAAHHGCLIVGPVKRHAIDSDVEHIPRAGQSHFEVYGRVRPNLRRVEDPGGRTRLAQYTLSLSTVRPRKVPAFARSQNTIGPAGAPSAASLLRVGESITLQRHIAPTRRRSLPRRRPRSRVPPEPASGGPSSPSSDVTGGTRRRRATNPPTQERLASRSLHLFYHVAP